jgi:AraC-like DNA-binding protein
MVSPSSPPILLTTWDRPEESAPSSRDEIMRAQSHHPAVIDARRRVGQAPRRHQHASPVSPASTIDSAARLRFWRPLPPEAADIICGEGVVGELPIHTHEALRVMLPASRFALVDARHAAMVVRPGQVHVAAPLELYGARSLDDVPCGMRVILLAPTVLPSLGVELSALWRGAAPGLQQLVVDDPGLYAELWALVGELRGPLVALAHAPRLLACLARLLAGLAARPADAPPPPVGRQVIGVGRVGDYLRAHVAENVSLDELAGVAGLSKFYLLRAFRRAHGVTPHAYQMQLRLAHAWRFIAEGRPLSRATYDAGFADQSHLTRRFAAVFGITPARYARQLAVPPGAVSGSASGAAQSAASPSAA